MHQGHEYLQESSCGTKHASPNARQYALSCVPIGVAKERPMTQSKWKCRQVVVLTFLWEGAAPVTHAAVFSESVSGDLPSFGTPLPTTILDVGINTVSG